MINCVHAFNKECDNRTYCHLCENYSLFKIKEEKAYTKPIKNKKRYKKGRKFEEDTVKKWNKAILQVNSGAIYDMPGDIITIDSLLECKERSTITTKGKKTFTIHLDWLKKTEGEALRAGKPYWYLPLHFKDDDKTYVIMDFDQQLEILGMLEYYKNQKEQNYDE